MFTIDLLILMIRFSLLMAAGYFAARLLAWTSAAIAHRVLVTTLACTLTLPLMSMMVPSWKWMQPSWLSISEGTSRCDTDMAETPPITAARTVVETSEKHGYSDPSRSGLNAWFEYVNEETAAAGGDSLTDTDLRFNRNGSEAKTFEPQMTADVETFTTVEQAEKSPVVASWDWPRCFVAVWLLVSGLLTGRLIYALLNLFRFINGCSPVSPEVASLVERVASGLGTNRTVHVAVSIPDAMPMACWLGRWILILPSNFSQWRTTMQETTLVHELGHIVRRDAWSDLLAQCVFCSLWPNPFSWLSMQLLRRLRERVRRVDIAKVCNRRQDLCRMSAGSGAAAVRLSNREPRPRWPVNRIWNRALRWLMSASRPRVDRPIFTAAMVAAVGCLGLAIATAQPTPLQPSTVASSEQKGVNADPVLPLHDVIVSKDPSPADPAISVAGIVTDIEGKPLGGMEVVLCEKATSRTTGRVTFRRFPDVLARTTTNDRGRFAFNGIGIPPRMTDTIANLHAGTPGAELLVWGPGKALAWVPVQSFQNPDKQIRLTPEADVSGIVVDDAGNPVKNADLTVLGFTRSTNYVDENLADVGDLNLHWSEVQPGSTTNNGKFRIPNLPQDYRVAVICTGQNGGRKYFYIDTGKGDSETMRINSPSYRSAASIHRTPITVSLTPRARVQIQVRDHNGKPVEGGVVEAIDKDRRFGGFAQVDSKGIAQFGVQKPGIHKIYYSSDPLTPAMGMVQTVDVQPGESQIVEMKLSENKWLTGKVVDQGTGAAIVGAYVWGRRIDSTDAVMSNSTENLVVSGDDGVFRLPVVAGEWKLKLYGDVDGYFDDHEYSKSMMIGSENSVNVTVSEEHVPDDVIIKLGRGLVINGVLKDFEGKPQAGVIVKAESEGSRGRRAATLTDEAGQFQFSGFSPYKAVQISSWTESGSAEQVIYRHRDQKSADRLIENIELEMYSGATLTGRVMKDGTPAQNITVRVKKSLPINAVPDKFQMISEKTTDEAGNYTFNGLLKGDIYEIEIDAPGYIEIPDMRRPFGTTVKSHATIYMPDIRVVTNQQKLSGKVIDLEGNPLPGITVAASLRILGDIACPAKGEPPWNTSDKEGRFSLTDLPDEPITLMAHRWSPAGGRINYLVKVHPELNATDIRIVYDPKRDSGGEQLDAK